MVNPKDDPVGFCLQCKLNPSDPTFRGSAIDAAAALDAEIERETASVKKLKQARQVLRERHGL